ncbi:MAG: nucleotidyltransferase family protein [Fidelibacterota bacterium]|nr:MAG: nucleotidyltransferase family protein [Candidatus Neomarinimicrobiota bacterium]
MRAIIPVAGEGTRLLPYTEKRQKALLPAGGKAVLDHVLEPLLASGIDEVSLVIGYKGDQVREHMERYTELPVTFIEQVQQRGLGEAVYLALEDTIEPVVIVLADTIFELNYAEFMNEEGNLIGVVEVEDPRRFGVVEVAGRQVVRMIEKPDKPVSNLAIAGIYRIENQEQLRHALTTLIESGSKTKGEYQLTDALNLMVERGESFRTFPVDRWLDCGTKETLLATSNHLLQTQGGAFIHPDSTVEQSTVRTSSIMENCVVRASFLDNCIVLPNARLEKCNIRDEIVEEDAELEGYSSGS